MLDAKNETCYLVDIGLENCVLLQFLLGSKVLNTSSLLSDVETSTDMLKHHHRLIEYCWSGITSQIQKQQSCEKVVNKDQ